MARSSIDTGAGVPVRRVVAADSCSRETTKRGAGLRDRLHVATYARRLEEVAGTQLAVTIMVKRYRLVLPGER